MQKSSAAYGLFPGINQVTISAFLAVTVVFAFSTPAVAIDNTPPAIASTMPANGALGVSANPEAILITFMEPMGAFTNYTYSPSLGSHTPQWSEDPSRPIPARADRSTPLADGTIVQININPYGSKSFMEDMAGNHLRAYSFSFLLTFFEGHKPSSAGINPSIPLLLLGDS